MFPKDTHKVTLTWHKCKMPNVSTFSSLKDAEIHADFLEITRLKKTEKITIEKIQNPD